MANKAYEPAMPPEQNAEDSAFISPVDSLAGQSWSEQTHQVIDEINVSHDFSSLVEDSRDFLTTTQDPLSGTRTPRGLMTFGLETDLDLSIIDLHFLDSYNSQIPFEFEELVPAVSDTTTTQYQGVEYSSDGKEERSSQRLKWRFVPAPQDHGYCEHDNLLLPAQTDPASTPQSLVEVANQPAAEKLDLSSRDRILSIVLSQLKHPISAAVHSFPSTEFLDSLIRYYMTAPLSTASSWIHRAGFRPRKACPELLLAMAGAGAVLTPDASLRKLGFAMEEVVRLQLPGVFEEDNQRIYDLELLQAYLLYLEVGLWSGNNRKIELSDAFRQPLITMVRRRGMFHHSAYPAISVNSDDTGDSLHEKWREWIGQESYKRLAFHLLRLDAELSMALLTNPVLSYAEVCLPLPAPEQLWLADNPFTWRNLYCKVYASGGPRIPTLTECIANMDLIESSRDMINKQLSCGALLNALWGTVWEYRQFSSVLGTQSRYWDNGLLMASRAQQITKILETFRLQHKNESEDGIGIGIGIVLHFILMHMNMSLEEIQSLATCDDPIRACDEQPLLAVRSWCKSREARQASWHASQIIRGLKHLQFQGIRDFKAIALYHASLVLWAYGMAGTDSMHSEGPNVWLDAEENTETQRYIALSRGVPVIQGGLLDGGFIALSQPRRILETMIDLLQSNSHCDPGMQPPPLVANLVLILGKLRDVSR